MSSNSKIEINEIIERLNGQLNEILDKSRDFGTQNLLTPRDSTYVSEGLFDNYIYDMKIIQQFVNLNKRAMAEEILNQMNFVKINEFTTIHNYIDTELILRKGAVSAKAGKSLLLIPINMRDGSSGPA
ncbi:MAG: RtcB family protein [Oscillospiraceae bacterium]|jgi:hypothetical protein|nr:RtcB family protein [Oscillospiraceae bacterium]